MASRPASVRYTLHLTITQPLDIAKDDDAEMVRDTIENFTNKDEQRRLEHRVIDALRRLDGDADCEVLGCELLDADGEEVELEAQRDAWDDDYERQAHRARMDNFAKTGGKDWT